MAVDGEESADKPSADRIDAELEEAIERSYGRKIVGRSLDHDSKQGNE